MLNIKDNLHKPIKDCEPGAKNKMTYLEWIIWGHANIGNPLTSEQIDYLCDKATNKELNDWLEEIDYLLTK